MTISPTEGNSTEFGLDAAFLLSALLRATDANLYVKDLAGRYLLVSDAGAAALGRDRSAIIGRTDFELFAVAEAEAHARDDHRVLAEGVTQTYEELRGQGESWLVTKGPLRDSSGRTVALFGWSRELTSVRRAAVSDGVFGLAPKPAGARSVALDALTERQREVLAFIGRGADNMKIAAHLHITERTVKAHVSNLYAKIGAENRLELALFALRHELAPRT